MGRYIPDLYKPFGLEVYLSEKAIAYQAGIQAVQYLHAGEVKCCSYKLLTPGKYLSKSISPVENCMFLGDFNAEIMPKDFSNHLIDLY